MKLLRLIVTIFCVLSTNTIVSQVNFKQKIIGSWKVQEIHYQYMDTTYVAKDQDNGRFLFTKTHYALMYNPRMQLRKSFKILSKPNNEEIINAFRNIVFNTGSYILKDSTISTTADIAKVPGFEGGKQFYNLKLEGDNLQLTMFDETYPNGEKPEWYEKLKIKFILIRE